jgi:hypothetical protein
MQKADLVTTGLIVVCSVAGARTVSFGRGRAAVAPMTHRCERARTRTRMGVAVTSKVVNYRFRVTTMELSLELLYSYNLYIDSPTVTWYLFAIFVET